MYYYDVIIFPTNQEVYLQEPKITNIYNECLLLIEASLVLLFSQYHINLFDCEFHTFKLILKLCI